MKTAEMILAFGKSRVQRPELWHFLRFCHSNFFFESCFQ
jgi:hypothetical protein